MPTPDTETLAARLRAVERALTDDDADLDPPSDGVAGAEPSPEAAVASGESGPDEVTDRLCRLEAAVQALHAALEERDSTPGSEPTAAERTGADTDRPARTPGTATDGTTELPGSPPDAPHDSRGSATTDWPDDLAAE